MASKASNQLYDHPFSKAYWRDAAAEFRDPRMLIFAALMIAIRVALKPVKIPLGPSLDINSQFIVNAVGAMTFGPVVAIAAAAVSDTLGCLLFPNGPYFFPFIFTEIAGSLLFALFLYRAKITAKRVILCRFSVCFLVNLVLQTPIMIWYYRVAYGTQYAWMDIPRLLKNFVLFPLESVALIVVLRFLVPALNRQKMIRSQADDLRLNKKRVILLVSLTVVGLLCVGGYNIYSYNHTSLSASYTSQERLEKNQAMNALICANDEGLAEEDTVTIIESAYPRFGSSEVTYTLAVYAADREAIEGRSDDPEGEWQKVRGYSKSKARNDEALTLIRTVELKLDSRTGDLAAEAVQ